MEEKKTTTKAFDELPDDWTCVICGATKEEYENKLAENEGPVTEDDLVAEIVNLYPEAIPILMGVGMHCFGCAAARGETLRDACRVHGLRSSEIVKELNRAITGQTK